METKKRLFFISLCLSSLFLTLCFVTDTYAKYLTTATSTSEASIARWKIIVNEEDITLGTASSGIITPIFPGNDDISANVIAPNAEGYYDIALDTSNVDVSFRYTITTVPNENGTVKEIIPIAYQIDGGDRIELSGTTTISSNINYSNNSNITNIRVFVKWDDSLEIMDNEEDTETTKGTNPVALLDVTLNVIQISN